MKRISLQKGEKKNTTQKPTDEKLHTQPKAMNQREAFTQFWMNSFVRSFHSILNEFICLTK